MQGSEDHLFLLSIRRADSESALAFEDQDCGEHREDQGRSKVLGQFPELGSQNSAGCCLCLPCGRFWGCADGQENTSS